MNCNFTSSSQQDDGSVIMKSCAQLNRFTIERTSAPAGKEPRLTRWNVVGICTEMTGVTEAFLYIFFFKII